MLEQRNGMTNQNIIHIYHTIYLLQQNTIVKLLLLYV